VFFKYLDFIFAPFRAINSKIIGVRNVKGNIQSDMSRVKNLANQGKQQVQKAQGFNQQMQNYGQQPQQPGQQPQPGQYQQGGQYMQPGMPPGAPGQPGMPGAPGGAPGAPGMPMANPPIRTAGFWIFKKKFCSQCEQQLDKTWDQCPFCVQIAQQAAIPPAQRQAMKTQAFVMDATGGPSGVQLLGWIVPLQGPQRGELFTLQPNTTIGTDAKSTIVLTDKFMSSKHAEIKAENGIWVLRDSGSTNGTYVNNRRIDRHELVDNDFIKFGSAMLKFKSL
jgi:FHA domain